MTADLVILTPDVDTEACLRGVFSRPRRLTHDDVRPRFLRHPRHDPGCRSDASPFLRSSAGGGACALVVFDLAGCGADDEDPAHVERYVEDSLRPDWGDRARAIVVAPEIEAWLWSDSPHVAKAMGWSESTAVQRRWLQAEGLWPAELPKPPDPKSAFHRAVGRSRVIPGPGIFARIGREVGVDRCEDRAFTRLKTTLRAWYGEPV